MLAAVKRLVGADRAEAPAHHPPTLDRAPLERPVDAARRSVDAATQAHEATMASLADADAGIVAAQQAFDAEPTEGNVSTLLEAKRTRERRELFAQRTARAACAAQDALTTAERTRDAAVLAHLEDRAKGAPGRVMALCAQQGLPALQALVVFTSALDTILTDARAATVEAIRIRGGVEHAEVLGLDSLRGVVKSWIAGQIGADSLIKIARLVD